jgi:hypothetical protein
MAGLGCSHVSRTVGELSGGFTTSLEGYFESQEYGPRATSPQDRRQASENGIKAVKNLTAAFESWSRTLDEYHASGSLRLPGGVTWQDVDAYRRAVGVFLADEADASTRADACWKLTDYKVGGPGYGGYVNCVNAITFADGARWQHDHDAMIAARAKAGLACIHFDSPCPEDQK